MTKDVFVYLTGGLGNQLFQLASALSSLKDASGRVFLDVDLGLPRKTNGKVDILYMSLPNHVYVFDKPASKFTRKVAGFLLRNGINPKRWESNPIIKSIILFLGKIVLSLRYRRMVSLEVADNVGRFDFNLKRCTLLIGYFQTFTSIKHISRNVLAEITCPLSVRDEVGILIEKALEEQPIFLHVRLTDYLLEKNFGNLDTGYYRDCLKMLDDNYRNIWVFSDDVEKAKELLPNEYQDRYFYVIIDQVSPAELLYLLRHGSDYVIANSTFSWWGASSRIRPTAKVIAPIPWFARMVEPEDLIPTEWIRKKVTF